MSYRPKYLCKCPFYEKEYKEAICCEAVVSGASENVMYFASEAEKDDYVRKHCIQYEPNCELYKLLMKKYD